MDQIAEANHSTNSSSNEYVVTVNKHFFQAVTTSDFPDMKGNTDLHARPFAHEFGKPHTTLKGFWREFSSNEGRKKGILLVERQPNSQYEIVIFFYGSGGLSNFTDGFIPCSFKKNGKLLKRAFINTSEAMWKLICIAVHSGLFYNKETEIETAIQALQSAKDVTGATRATKAIQFFLSGYWDQESMQAMFATIAAKWSDSLYMDKLLDFFTALFQYEDKDIIEGLNIWNGLVHFVEGNPYDGRWGVKKDFEQALDLLIIAGYDLKNWLHSMMGENDKNLLGIVLTKVFYELKQLGKNDFTSRYADNIVFQIMPNWYCFYTKLKAAKRFYLSQPMQNERHCLERDKILELDTNCISIIHYLDSP